MTDPLATPPTSIDAALWIATLSPDEVAFVQGVAFQRLAAAVGETEAALYAEWAERAAADPDCQVVRPW